MSGGGSGESNMTQSTKVELPSWYEPIARAGVNLGVQQAQQPYQQYNGVRIAPMALEQEQGLQMATQRAQNGSPLVKAAQQNATDTINGKYLGAENPAWDPMVSRITDAYRVGTAAQTDRGAAMSNAFGGSAHNEAMQRNQTALGDSLAGFAGQLYNTERGNQMAAMNMAPTLANQDYVDAQNLIGVGDARRQYAQDIANQAQSDFYDAQNYGWNQLNQLASLGNNFLGNSQTQTQTGPNPYQSNPMAGAIGGGMLGYSAGSALGSGALAGTAYGSYAGPIGALLGAGLGYAMS